MKRAYKFRLYPTRQQEATLEDILDTCRPRGNLAPEDRRIHYKEAYKSGSYEDQAALLIIGKLSSPAFNSIKFIVRFSRMYLDGSRKLLITSLDDWRNMVGRMVS